jgi:TrmH family RNA methyltransferase
MICILLYNKKLRLGVKLDKKKLAEEVESFQETQLNKEYENLTFTVILIQPETKGNIGSVARVMKNFNFSKLIVFNPTDSVEAIRSHESQGFAMHGKDILLNSEIINIENQKNHISELKEFLKKFDLVLATTAKGSRHTNIKRIAVFPEDFSLPISENPLNIAILFGKESRGLTNDEIRLADINIRIPASDEYPTLNLSHACGIILYEIFKKLNILNIGRGRHPVILADKKDRSLLYEFVDKIAKKVKIRTYKEENLYDSFKNVFERAFMTKRELSLITGLFSKIHGIINDMDIYSN